MSRTLPARRRKGAWGIVFSTNINSLNRGEYPSKRRPDQPRCVVGYWRMDYNQYRPYSDPDYRPALASAAMCLEQSCGSCCLN